jgi:glucan phosphoethanolaminetransferase (alkaline phosphatase superfamily)
MRNLLKMLVICGILTGCAGIQKMFNPAPSPSEVLTSAVAPEGNLSVLSGVGGLCLLSGMALLVISKGTMGWRPVIGGVILVILNYMVAAYANWIFIPMLIATGCISAVWGWKVVESILNHKETCK